MSLLSLLRRCVCQLQEYPSAPRGALGGLRASRVACTSASWWFCTGARRVLVVLEPHGAKSAEVSMVLSALFPLLSMSSCLDLGQAPGTCACSSPEMAARPKFGLVVCDGTITDGGFLSMLYLGVTTAVDDSSTPACYDVWSGDACNDATWAEATAQFATYDMVLCAGFQNGQLVYAAAEQNPSVSFVLGDASVANLGPALPNLQGVQFASDQSAYAVGFLAGLVTRSGIIGVIAGPELSTVMIYANGFRQGVHDSCASLGKECSALVKYVNSFAAPGRGAAVAQYLAERGADIFFEIGGTTGTCALASVAQLDTTIGVIGVGIDRSEQPDCPSQNTTIPPAKLLSSALKRLDKTVEYIVARRLTGESFFVGDSLFDATLDGVGLADCHSACNLTLPRCPENGAFNAADSCTVADAIAHVRATIMSSFAMGDTLGTGVLSAGSPRVLLPYTGGPDEVVNLAPRSVLPGSAIDVGLSGHTAVLYPGGNPFAAELGGGAKFVVFGGSTQQGLTNAVHLYMPSDNAWGFLELADLVTSVGTSPSPRAGHSATMVGTAMIVFGGRIDSGVAEDVWWMDLGSYLCSWQGPMQPSASWARPAGRTGHSAVSWRADGAASANASILVFGGRTGSGQLMRDLWELIVSASDGTALEWRELVTPTGASSPPARRDHTATWLDDRMLVFGGRDANGPLGDLWSYAPLVATWTLLTPSSSGIEPLPRYEHVAFAWSTAAAGTVLAVSGGYDGESQMLSRLDVFNPQEQVWHRHLTWSRQPPSEAAPPLAAHAAVVHGDHTYFLGGQTRVEDLSGQAQILRTGHVFRRLASEPLAAPRLVTLNTTLLELAWTPSLAYEQSATSSEEQLAAMCPGANATGLINTYELQLFAAGQWTTLYQGLRTSWVSSGLEPNTTYLFRARGGNARLGMGDWSVSLAETTAPEPAKRHRKESYVTIIMPAVAVVILLALALCLYRHWRLVKEKEERLYMHKGPLRHLHLASGLKYHVFMSHTWSTGQSQVHNLVSELKKLMPQLAIFLDVDCLEDTTPEALREHIAETAAILLFLSRGYFRSKACEAEYRAAAEQKKDLILVHEGNYQHGGAPMKYLRQECPEDLRECLLDGRPIVPWLTSPHHRLVTFKHIVASILKSLGTHLPAGVGSLPLFGHVCLGHHLDPHLTILQPLHADTASSNAVFPSPAPAEHPQSHGSLKPIQENKATGSVRWKSSHRHPIFAHRKEHHHAHFQLPEPLELFYSDDNPGSRDVVDTLRAEILGIELTKMIQENEYREASLVFDETTWREAERSALGPIGAWLSRPQIKSKGQTLPPIDLSLKAKQHVFVLVLNQSTFLGDEGRRLEQAVARALVTPQLDLLLIHCEDDENDGCAFETIIEHTPRRLLIGGIYKPIAQAWFADASYKAITVSSIAESWDARPRPRPHMKNQSPDGGASATVNRDAANAAPAPAPADKAVIHVAEVSVVP